MGHMNSIDVGKFSKEAGVREVLLTHLPHYGDYTNLIIEAIQFHKGNISLASSGWTWGQA